MPAESAPTRQFTDREVGLILRTAVELQEKAVAPTDVIRGMSLAELEGVSSFFAVTVVPRDGKTIIRIVNTFGEATAGYFMLLLTIGGVAAVALPVAAVAAIASLPIGLGLSAVSPGGAYASARTLFRKSARTNAVEARELMDALEACARQYIRPARQETTWLPGEGRSHVPDQPTGSASRPVTSSRWMRRITSRKGTGSVSVSASGMI